MGVGLPGNFTVNELVYDPTNPNVVYAATTPRAYSRRTNDGGSEYPS